MGLLAGSVLTDYQIHLGKLIVVVAVNVCRRGACVRMPGPDQHHRYAGSYSGTDLRW